MPEDKYQLFHELYKSGIRFISSDQHNSLQHGIYNTDNSGQVEGYTIKGMQKLAENKKITVDGEPLTPDEVEMLFNIVSFDRSISK